MPDDDFNMGHAAPTPGPSSRSAQKRKRSPSPLAGSSRTKRARKAPKKSRKPKRPSDWHLKRGELPANAESTKLALEVHLRALWQLPHQNATPPKVTKADRLRFSQRFSSVASVKTSVQASLDDHATNINEAKARVRQLLENLPEDRSITANHIRRISESHLLLMYRSVSFFGLPCWAPDIISSDPDSMYNILHEQIALITFEQVAGAFGYSHLGINLQLVQDFVLLRKLYRSFVFSHMYKIAKLEAKSPGSIAKGNEMTNVWKRRKELADGRVDLLKAQAFNKWAVGLAEENEAHSDDEPVQEDGNSDEQIYHIKVKDGRSTKVKTFFRMLDRQQKRIASGKRRYHRVKRRREEPDPPQESELSALPKRVPIDWFEPEYWNNVLTVRERLQYMNDGTHIALPAEQHCQTWEGCSEWKNLPEKEFMERYGDEVLALYNIPTEEEVDQFEQWERGAREAQDAELESDSDRPSDADDIYA